LAAALRGSKRLAEVAGVFVGSFAVLHHARDVAAYAERWDAGGLPGAPTFRLSPKGGSLEALAQAAAALPSGPARTALAAVLPACLLPEDDDGQAPASPGVAFDYRQLPGTPPSGSDRLGAFTPCTCDAQLRERCPGLAVGWSYEGPMGR
jgi:hypothetical protein